MRRRLSEPEIEAALQRVPGWRREGGEIVRTFIGKDFAESMIFVNRVAACAEELDHHPDVDIRWNKVTLRLSTHSAGGLTILDFDLAARLSA